MVPQVPQIARPRDRRHVVVGSGHVVFRFIAPIQLLGHHVDLADLEAGKFDIEAEIDRRKLLQFDGEEFAVPAGEFGQAVVGDDVSASFIGGQVVEPDDGNSAEAELLRGGDASVACNDPVVVPNQDRVRESELRDARGDLGNLLVGMRACVSVGRD